MKNYRIHNMHGPTVFASERMSTMLEELWRLRRSNGGLYRLVDERSGKEIASINTNATYDALNYEENEKRRTK